MLTLQPAIAPRYAILGVNPTATPAAVRSAYRKLVLKWHPDKNIGKEKSAEVMAARLNNAYEILGDPDERRRCVTLQTSIKRTSR